MKRARPRSGRRGKLSKTTARVEVDFVGLLPQEIVEQIFSQLDVETITNCKMVCKSWCAMILASSHLWRVVFEKLGLCVDKEQSPQEVVDYKDIFLRVRNRVQQMKDDEFTRIEAFHSKIERTTCLYYHNGIVAVGSLEGICLWKLEPNLELVLKLDGDAICIQFDESFLVAGTVLGELTTWKLPAGKELYSYVETPWVPISAVAFNKELDLVVSASVTSTVTIWRLTTGKILVPQFDVDQNNHMWHTQLQLIVNPGVELSEGCDCLLICVCVDVYCALNFNSKEVSSTLTLCPFRKFDMDDSPIEDLITTIHVSNSHINILCSHHSSWTTTLCTMNLRNGGWEYVHRFNDCFEGVLGEGKKYICMLARARPHSDAKHVVIVDVPSNKEVARLTIPEYFSKEFIVHKCLGNTSWLDGFSGFNDKDTLLVSGSSTYDVNVIHVVKWST